MIETCVFAALALVVAGVTIGILIMICLGIKQDDRPGRFPAYNDDLTARAARRGIGVGTRVRGLPARPAADGNIPSANWASPGHREIIIPLPASVLFKPEQAL